MAKNCVADKSLRQIIEKGDIIHNLYYRSIQRVYIVTLGMLADSFKLKCKMTFDDFLF